MGALLGEKLLRACQGVDVASDRVLIVGDDALELRACLDKEFMLNTLVDKGNLLTVSLSKRGKQVGLALLVIEFFERKPGKNLWQVKSIILVELPDLKATLLIGVFKVELHPCLVGISLPVDELFFDGSALQKVEGFFQGYATRALHVKKLVDPQGLVVVFQAGQVAVKEIQILPGRSLKVQGRG